MDASLFLFLQLFDKKRRHQWDGAEEQLTQGVWVCWFGQVSETGESWTESHRGSSAFKKILQLCTGPSWTDTQSEEAQLFS